MNSPPNPNRPDLSLGGQPSVAYHVIKFAIWTLALACAGVVVLFVSRELGILPRTRPQDKAREAAQVDADKPDKPAFTPPEAVAPKQPPAPPDTTKEGEMRARRALAKTKQRATLTRVKEVLEALDAWEKERRKFADTEQAILADDRGKKIAANPALFSKARAVLEQPRPNALRIGDLRGSAELLKTSLETSLQDQGDASVPAEELTQQLASMLSEATEGENAFRQANDQFEALINAASADKTPRAETLQAALDRTRREEAEQEAAAIAEARARAREETSKKLVMQREREELEKGRLEVAERKARMKAEADQRESRIREERLWRIARSQRARELLQPAVALSPRSKMTNTWQVRLLGQVFNNHASFRDSLMSVLIPYQEGAPISLGGPSAQAQAAYNARERDCKKEFDMTLHQLFREVCLRDQENAFLTDVEVDEFINANPNSPLARRPPADLLKVPPPPPLAKPDWLKD